MSAPHRKLTTIFSADVQGYSRLMEADEEGTLTTLKQYRDAMARLIESHAGRVVNTWGDGLIAEFASVVEAVRAAIDVQNELAGRNAGRPAKTRMLFRIGINLGDVIADGEDIYGDGVNIAARLQASAPPGGIVISNTVYDQVRNKVAVGFAFLGNLSVKNIDESVPSYAVRIGDQTDMLPAGRSDKQSSHRVFARERAETDSPGRWAISRSTAVLALIMVVLVVINLLSWEGVFWAKWVLLAFAWREGHVWARRMRRIDRGVATLGVIGLGIVGINLLAWHGEFWAKWPLLGIALAAGVRWTLHRGASNRPAR